MLSSGAVYPGVSAHEGQRGRDRLERSHRTGEELLLDRRQPLLDGVQLVHADPVLQQGSLSRRRGSPTRRRRPGTRSRGWRRSSGRRGQVRVQLGVAVVGAGREHAWLPRSALRRPQQRLRRAGDHAQDQRPVRHQDDGAPRARRQGGLVHVRRAAEQGRGAHDLRRVRDLHDLVGLHRQSHPRLGGKFTWGTRFLPRLAGFPQGTRSSAAPRSGS